jgi:hypothetical protein
MASDEELERRLRQLKGLDTPTGRTPASSGGAPRPSGGTPASSGGTDPGEVLEGEVIEPGDLPRSAAGRPVGPGGQPPGVGTRVVSWSVDQATAGRLRLWFGVALVVIGTYYVLAAFIPGVRIAGSLGIAVLGGLLLAANLTSRAGEWARTLGAVLVGAGVLPFVAGIAGMSANGWGSLGAGLGLLVLAAIRATRGRGMGWQGVTGTILVIWGAWGVLGDRVPGFPSLGDLIVPVILLVIGIVFVRRAARGPVG